MLDLRIEKLTKYIKNCYNKKKRNKLLEIFYNLQSYDCIKDEIEYDYYNYYLDLIFCEIIDEDFLDFPGSLYWHADVTEFTYEGLKDYIEHLDEYPTVYKKDFRYIKIGLDKNKNILIKSNLGNVNIKKNTSLKYLYKRMKMLLKRKDFFDQISILFYLIYLSYVQIKKNEKQ
jgi:hypothetical protein